MKKKKKKKRTKKRKKREREEKEEEEREEEEKEELNDDDYEEKEGGLWKEEDIMPSNPEDLDEEDVKALGRKSMTLQVRLNLTPCLLHTFILFKTLTLQFYVYLMYEKVNKGKKVND